MQIARFHVNTLYDINGRTLSSAMIICKFSISSIQRWFVADFSLASEAIGRSRNAIDDAVLRDTTENNQRQTTREITLGTKVRSLVNSTVIRHLGEIREI